MNKSDLSGKIIVITGASSGIGASIAISLAKENAKLILLARNIDKLKSVQQSIINDDGKAYYYSVDLGLAEKVEEISAQIMSEHGVPDIIINSAGAGRWLSLEETSMNEFEEMINSPLLATSFVCKAFLKAMKERNSGHIITINSVGCYFAFPGATGYLSARWGLRGFMESLSEDLINSKIKTTMIVAGKVDSPYFSTNEGAEDRIPRIALMLSKTLSLKEVALQVVRVIHSPVKTRIIPRSMAILVFTNRFFPRLFRYLMRNTSNYKS